MVTTKAIPKIVNLLKITTIAII